MKVKITADAVLKIIQNIFDDEDVNCVIDDVNAPEWWRGKSLKEALNIEYFSFKHRPESSEKVIGDLIKEGKDSNLLLGANRSFCLFYLSGIERLFSKDVDMVTLSATMEYWLQTSKVKLLEDLIEECNIRLSGWRVPVVFGNETRQAVIIFDRPSITDIQSGTPYGEMAQCEINVNMLFYPDVVSYKDYEVRFTFNDGGKVIESGTIPLSTLSFVSTMTQRALPTVQTPQVTGNINLARSNSFVLVFDGYNNEFINYITDIALQGTTSSGELDNNEMFTMNLIRMGKTYTHSVVIKDHQTTINADTGNETHTLALVTRGI